MTQMTNTSLKDHIKRFCFSILWLAGLILLTGAGWYSTTELKSKPVGLNNALPQNVTAIEQSTDQAIVTSTQENQPLTTAPATFAPFLDIVPSQDGTELFISAGGVGEVGGTVVANIGVGSGNDKGGHTMTYSNTIRTYLTTASGFTPQANTFAPLNITTTLGLDTGIVMFNRAYIPASTTQTINSIDASLQLTLVSTDTFPSEAYVVVVPGFAPPGPPPLGHQLVGSVYSVRASGAIVVADKPMSLRLAYNNTTLAGADPHTLAIFAWDAANKQWNNLGGTLFSAQQYLSVATSRFTTYALMATPTWRDEFDEFSGLDFDQFDNITFGGTPGNRTLILTSTPGSGSAISQPITPTTTFANWGNLTFTGVVTPPTTTLGVDVLNLDNTPILTNVTSGTSLVGLDPAQYPALKLRVNMTSTATGQTPSLKGWQLAWQTTQSPPAGDNKVYLPLVLK